MIEKAIETLKYFVSNNFGSTINDDDIRIVHSSQILQNFKCIIYTIYNPEMYYELMYDSEKCVWTIIIYTKHSEYTILD